MPTFFDLPREIRDIIYSLVLTSPSGHITTHLYKEQKRPQPSSSKLPAQFSFRLQFLPCDAVTFAPHPDALPLSTALSRTNRQIYAETRDIFWRQNILAFTSAYYVIVTLRHMGQAPSRLIQRVRVDIMSRNVHKAQLAKSLSMLASRARHGHLREVRLVVHRLRNSAVSRLYENGLRPPLWDSKLLQILDSSAEAGWGKVQRIVELDEAWDEVWPSNVHYPGEGVRSETDAKLLAIAWGGVYVRSSISS